MPSRKRFGVDAIDKPDSGEILARDKTKSMRARAVHCDWSATPHGCSPTQVAADAETRWIERHFCVDGPCRGAEAGGPFNSRSGRSHGSDRPGVRRCLRQHQVRHRCERLGGDRGGTNGEVRCASFPSRAYPFRPRPFGAARGQESQDSRDLAGQPVLRGQTRCDAGPSMPSGQRRSTATMWSPGSPIP